MCFANLSNFVESIPRGMESTPENNNSRHFEIAAGEHQIAEIIGEKNGPTLIVVGGIHGNERSGVVALRRVNEFFDAVDFTPRGRIFFLAGNTRALIQNERYIDSDLNRNWSDESSATNSSEEKERNELRRILGEIEETAKDEIYVIDLHSTSSKSEPFALTGDTIRNHAFVRNFPISVLLGIEEKLDGTLLEYLNNRGMVALGFEAGEHGSKFAIRNQEALIYLAMEKIGLISSKDFDIEVYEKTLLKTLRHPRFIEIVYRYAIEESDNFKMKPGYSNFDKIKKGELLATDKNGEIYSEADGMILMPLYQAKGDDGFFVGRRFSKIDQLLARGLRALRLQNMLHFIPGVSLDPTNDHTLIIKPQVFRYIPRKFLHLLGYRRERRRGVDYVVRRRRHGRISPFKNV